MIVSLLFALDNEGGIYDLDLSVKQRLEKYDVAM